MRSSGTSVHKHTLLTTPTQAAHISREDCARAAAAALARDLNENTKYDVDGPQPLNRRDVAEILRKKLKLAKPIRVSIVCSSLSTSLYSFARCSYLLYSTISKSQSCALFS